MSSSRNRHRCASLAAFASACLALSTPGCAGAPRTNAAPASTASASARAGDGDARATKERAVTSAARPIDRDFVKRMAESRSFAAGKPKGAPTPDGKAVLFLRSGPRDARQSLFEQDAATGAVRELLSPESVLRKAGAGSAAETVSAEEHARRERLRITATGFTAFESSLDSARVVVSLSGRLHVLTRATGSVVELRTGEGAAIDPHFSPDGRSVAYVRGADLYTVPSDGPGRETAVTRGGTATRTHGVAEFVAQEELGRSRGFWWSPDSSRLLYEEADTSKVETWSLVDLGHPERAPELVRYPRPGRPNADVRLGLVSAAGGATTWVEWDRGRLPYVARVEWARSGPLAIYALDRPQKNGELLRVDPATGRTRVLLAEHDDAWVNVDPSVPRFLADGQFLWSSERSGRWELELRGAGGEDARALGSSTPRVEYRELVDVDEARGEAIFAGAEVPSEQAIYAAPLAGDGALRTVARMDHGVVDARFGDAHGVFVAREGSRAASASTYRVRHVDGKEGPVVPSLAEDPGFVPRVEWTTAGDGAMEVALVRPRDFDPRRRYPIIDAAYAGPHHALVVADASRFLREQWIADTTSAVVVVIDARGTPGRGRAWERAIDHALAKVPLDGHVDALQALERKYPELDGSRVGVYGWSFGGYFAALAALERPDVYKVAVAGAPVTDWRDYDTCYTERYLGVPSGPGDAYDRASLLARASAPLLKRAGAGTTAAPLLVIHGTADDNVFFTHALHLTDALERGARPFELMPLVGVTHMPVDPALAEALWVKVALHLRARLE